MCACLALTSLTIALESIAKFRKKWKKTLKRGRLEITEKEINENSVYS